MSAMSYRTILVHLSDPRRAGRLLEVAVPMARKMSAHIVGLSIMPPYVVVPAMDGGGTSATIEEHRFAYRDDAARMKEQFLAATSDLPIAGEWREADAAFGTVAGVILDHGRAADIIVASQSDPQWGSSNLFEDPERLIMEAGRPVLLVPNEGRCALPPKRVLAAFDGRREAARAMFDALPLLRQADDVVVLWINPEKAGPAAGDIPAAEICAALARHGIKAQGVDGHAVGGDVGMELLRQAKLDAADLLVMGCYGHSRLREFILGGASRHVLAHMNLPVLMSH